MSFVLRPGAPADAAVCGAICFAAFKAINDEHHFPPDFPSAEVATSVLTMLLSNPGFYSVVAEKDGARLFRDTETGEPKEAAEIGERLARRLLAEGGRSALAAAESN